MYKKKYNSEFEKAWLNILYLASRKRKHKVNLLKTGVHSKISNIQDKRLFNPTIAMKLERVKNPPTKEYRVCMINFVEKKTNSKEKQITFLWEHAFATFE